MARRSRSGRSRVVQPFGSERSTESRSFRSARIGIQQANEPRPKAKEDLKCAICLEYLRDPKLLPCLHSYCKRCLLGVKPNGNQIKCPKCRSCHEIPNGGVEDFPADQVLANSLEMIEFQSNDDKKKAIPCNMCTEDDPATAHCSTCGNFLCDFCLKSHKRQVNYRSHKTISLDEVDKESIRSLDRPNHCDTHVGEVLKLYCKTCDKLICRDCTISDHRSHEYGFTSDQRPDVQKKVHESVQELVQKQKEFKEILSFIQILETSRETHSNSLEEDIKKAFDSYMDALSSQRKKLLESEKQAKDTDMKQIWAQKEFVETTLASLGSALRYTEQMSSCPSDSAMLAMNSKVAPQLTKLRSARWDISTLKLGKPLMSCVSNPPKVESVGDLQYWRYPVEIHLTVDTNVASRHTSTTRKYATTMNVQLGERVNFNIHAQAAENKLSLSTPTVTVDGKATLPTVTANEDMWSVDFLPLSNGYRSVQATFNVTQKDVSVNNNPLLAAVLLSGQHLTGQASISVSGFPNAGERIWDTRTSNTGTVCTASEAQQYLNRQYSSYNQPALVSGRVYVRWNNGVIEQIPNGYELLD